MDIFGENLDIINVIASLAIGGVIGLEREKVRQKHKETISVGITTCMLLALLGALSALYAEKIGWEVGIWVFLTSFVFVGVLNLLAYKVLSEKGKRIDFKSEVSAILVFMLGALTVFGGYSLSVLIGMMILMAFSFRSKLHQLSRMISYEEIIDAVKFGVIALVILPLLPDLQLDGYLLRFFDARDLVLKGVTSIDILNPVKLWILIVIISGINFLGYILVRIWGVSKGYGIMGLVGGLYSSTATSLSLAAKSKLNNTVENPIVAGIVLACAVSFLKMFVMIEALNSNLFKMVFPTMLLMMLYLLIVGGGLMIFGRKNKLISDLENLGKSPLQFLSVIRLFFIIVLSVIGANLVILFTDQNWYYFFSGLMSLLAIDDPVIISTSSMAGKALSMEVAKLILVSVITLNFVQKVGIVYWFGNRKLIRKLAVAMGGLVLVAGIGVLII